MQREHSPEEWPKLFRKAFDGLDGSVLARDTWRLTGKPPRQWRGADTRLVAGIMREMGFKRDKVRFPHVNGTARAWRRGETREARLKTIYVYWDPLSNEVHVGHKLPSQR